MPTCSQVTEWQKDPESGRSLVGKTSRGWLGSGARAWWGGDSRVPWGPAGAVALVLGTAVAVWVWAWATPWPALLKGVLQGSWGGPNRAADAGPRSVTLSGSWEVRAMAGVLGVILGGGRVLCLGGTVPTKDAAHCSQSHAGSLVLGCVHADAVSRVGDWDLPRPRPGGPHVCPGETVRCSAAPASPVGSLCTLSRDPCAPGGVGRGGCAWPHMGRPCVHMRAAQSCLSARGSACAPGHSSHGVGANIRSPLTREGGAHLGPATEPSLPGSPVTRSRWASLRLSHAAPAPRGRAPFPEMSATRRFTHWVFRPETCADAPCARAGHGRAARHGPGHGGHHQLQPAVPEGQGLPDRAGEPEDS